MMEEKNYAYPKISGVDPSCYIDAYNLVLECSQEHTPRSFSIKLLELLRTFCPYDKAVVMFLNINGKVSGSYTIGIEREWLDMFLNYYTGTIAPEYDIYCGKRETSGFKFSTIIDWARVRESEFKRDYITPMGLKYSWGFCFFDLNGKYRVIISLDRTRNEPFSMQEQNRLGLALPILNNIHRNFFYHGVDSRSSRDIPQSAWNQFGLTAREEEISNLLCQGMTAQNISSALYIAITTTYKHIANIFKKTGVSSQQELIVKLLSSRSL